MNIVKITTFFIILRFYIPKNNIKFRAMAKKETINPVLVRMKESAKGVIYESIVAMGIRARQINDEIKQELQERIADVASSTETEEPNFDQLLVSREFDRIPKPTILAMKEMFESQIEYYYPEEKKQSPTKTK